MRVTAEIPTISLKQRIYILYVENFPENTEIAGIIEVEGRRLEGFLYREGELFAAVVPTVSIWQMVESGRLLTGRPLSIELKDGKKYEARAHRIDGDDEHYVFSLRGEPQPLY